MIVYSNASRLRQTAATKESPPAVQVRKRREFVAINKNPWDTAERDRLMREMCRDGATTVEITEALGYSTPAAASRRMRQLGLTASKMGKP